MCVCVCFFISYREHPNAQSIVVLEKPGIELRIHREEEPHNNYEAPGRQTKQSNQLFLPHQDDCKTRMDIK